MKVIITLDEKIRDEKVLYHFTREATKIYALSSVKIDKCEWLAGKWLTILPLDQSILGARARLTYSPLGKTSEDNWKARIKSWWSLIFFKCS